MCKRPPSHSSPYSSERVPGAEQRQTSRFVNGVISDFLFVQLGRPPARPPTYHPGPCTLNFLPHNVEAHNAAGPVQRLRKICGHIASLQRPSDGPASTCCSNKANHSEEWSQPFMILRLPSLFRFLRVSGWFPEHLFHWVTVAGTGLFSH